MNSMITVFGSPQHYVYTKREVWKPELQAPGTSVETYRCHYSSLTGFYSCEATNTQEETMVTVLYDKTADKIAENLNQNFSYYKLDFHMIAADSKATILEQFRSLKYQARHYVILIVMCAVIGDHLKTEIDHINLRDIYDCIKSVKEKVCWPIGDRFGFFMLNQTEF